MRALVYTGPRRLELQQIPQPTPRAGEALVRVRAVGVCGSDLHGYLGRSSKRKPPLVLGHEFAGDAEGAPVAVYPIIGCGHCAYCANDRENLCPERKVYGLDFHGGLAECVTAPKRCLFQLPPSMSFVEGSLAEPLANAVHVLSRCPDVRGQAGLIYGAGPIGMLCLLVAKDAGAGRLAIVDRNPHRLAKMKELGAEIVIQADTQDPTGEVMEWTRGHGADFAIDAVGTAACRQNTISATASGGTVVCIGLEEENCQTDTRPVVTRELDIKGSYAYTRADFAHAIAMLEAKSVPWQSFLYEAALEQGEAVFEDLASGNSKIMKAVFLP